jgi:energy-coupling factor transporter ATP-binding protein EcfA2
MKILITGTHGTGKTTFAHALVGVLRRKSWNAGISDDAARRSRLKGRIGNNLCMQSELFGLTIEGEAFLTWMYEIVVCDRGILDILAYNRLWSQLGGEDDDSASLLKGAMESFGSIYLKSYSGIIVVNEPIRLTCKDDRLRDSTDSQIQAANHVNEVIGLYWGGPLLRLSLEDKFETQVLAAIEWIEEIVKNCGRITRSRSDSS